jgi:hypothetical protein
VSTPVVASKRTVAALAAVPASAGSESSPGAQTEPLASNGSMLELSPRGRDRGRAEPSAPYRPEAALTLSVSSAAPAPRSPRAVACSATLAAHVWRAVGWTFSRPADVARSGRRRLSGERG